MIKLYTCQRMSGRFCDEMVVEARMLVRVGSNYGFDILNPVIEEHIPMVHETLDKVPTSTLKTFWARDKQMIREADAVVDYLTMNASDGSNQEIGYNRWCLWKPTVRVWQGGGGLISKLEEDVIVPGYVDALQYVHEHWGTYEKLGQWRKDMLVRSFPKWMDHQLSLLDRYGVDRELLLSLQFGFGGEKV